MRGLITLGKLFGSGFMMIKRFIPPGLAIIFLIADFTKSARNEGLQEAFMSFAENLLVAEQTINEKVTLAINHSPEYGFMDLFAIASSVIILYYVIRIIGAVLIGITGSQAKFMAYVVGAVIVAILEFCVFWALNGSASFIPIRDGLWLLVMNFDAVIYQVDWLWLKQMGVNTSKEVINQTINSTNTTEVINTTINATT